MILYQNGSSEAYLSSEDLKEGVIRALDSIGAVHNILVIPPDITRFQSRAGELTRYIYEYNPGAVKAVLPALGTHKPMDNNEIEKMFGTLPKHLFREHHWRSDCVLSGTIPAEYVESISGGVVNYEIPVYFNRMIFEKEYDCIISVSQVVPHEVAGMAGFTKNLVVGLGGATNIHRTHFLGAAYGMEKIMGKTDSPVRKVLNYAARKFLTDLPIFHIMTVMGMDSHGVLKVRGLFIGDDEECYLKAARLSQQVNINTVDKPLNKVVVYLDPLEFKSTWLGNKSIYRTRMSIADNGELVVLAPGIRMFGEDPQIDALIRQFGYRGTPFIMEAVKNNAHLQGNLSAAAHLIHGSSEGRFKITYCTAGLGKSEIESVGFIHEPVEKMIRQYNPQTLREGFNKMSDGEEIYFISSPGIGLWAWKQNLGLG